MADEELVQITFAEFQRLVLESADEDGRVVFPVLSDGWAQMRWLTRMDWDGLIERTGPEKRYYNRTGHWVITEKGRAALGVGEVPRC